MLSIKDHLIVSKYVYEFHKINLNFKKYYHRDLFFNKVKASRMFLNGLCITPHPLNAYTVVHIVKSANIFTACAEKPLEDYVSLTRAPFSPLIKTWCDWCGMCNGYLEFLIDAINNYYQVNDVEAIERNNIKLIKLKVMLGTLKHLQLFAKKELSALKKAPARTETALFPNYSQAPQYIQKLLELVTKMYNDVQELEHIWCPFRYMKKIAFSAQMSPERHSHYLKCEDFEDVVKAGEILFNFRHIKCNQCIEVINEQLCDQTSSPALTNTEEYVKLLCRLSR